MIEPGQGHLIKPLMVASSLNSTRSSQSETDCLLQADQITGSNLKLPDSTSVSPKPKSHYEIVREAKRRYSNAMPVFERIQGPLMNKAKRRLIMEMVLEKEQTDSRVKDWICSIRNKPQHPPDASDHLTTLPRWDPTKPKLIPCHDGTASTTPEDGEPAPVCE